MFSYVLASLENNGFMRVSLLSFSRLTKSLDAYILPFEDKSRVLPIAFPTCAMLCRTGNPHDARVAYKITQKPKGTKWKSRLRVNWIFGRSNSE